MTKTIIIDDHSLFNDGLFLILKESGKFKVIEQIYDSRQAFSKCLSLKPALVIVDYNMPFLNGLEVVKQIKSLNDGCKVVIISMYADKKEVELFKEVAVDGYITKTTPSNVLIPALEKIMEWEQVFITHKFEKASTQKDKFALSLHLTKREREILKILKAGHSTEQVAQTLGLSLYTVETHRKNINQKLGFTTKKEFYDFLEQFD